VKVQPSELQTVRNILIRHVPEFEVWAFGSRVHGRHLKPHSDLDLAIMTNDPLPLNLFLDLKAAFSESDLPYRVDLIDWATTQPVFRTIVESCHEILANPASGH
jgi:predicted nucleotidyltransferase